MSFQTVRGFKDILPSSAKDVLSAEEVTKLEQIARKVFAAYRFDEIRVPTLESQELFVKSTGETTDIVEKEMFLLEDSGGRKLALRPEATPGIVRAYLQHNLAQQGGRTKLFYMGSMFRAERPQAGRFREFEQIDAESFGNGHPAADAEMIILLATILNEAGLKNRYSIHINNLGDEQPDCRPKFRKNLLEFLKSVEAELCDNCRRRMERNPLRALDCKADGPKLKGRMPAMVPCKLCREHFDIVTSEILKGAALEFVKDPSLVRGLDYYTRTVFEFKSKDVGSQDAIAGGGRYDGLVKAMGGADTPAIGWALGVERTLMAMAEARKSVKESSPERNETKPLIYIASQTDDSNIRTLASKFLYVLRYKGIGAEGGLFGHSLKSQMREADRLGARWVVIYGDEVKQNPSQCIVKNMRVKDKQELVNVSEIEKHIGKLIR